jgi:hypothetical protein
VTGILVALENRGYHFRVDGDHLKVEAQDHLLHHEAMMYLQEHKPEIMAACRLRNFLRLVRAFGVTHGLLLDDEIILGEPDESDRAELMTSELRDRQAWAELLAYRLTRTESGGIRQC